MIGLILRLLIIVILNIIAFGTGITQQIGFILTMVISIALFIISYCGEDIIDVIAEILENIDFND